jgi:hypothetical protein
MRTRDKRRIVRDFKRGESVVCLAIKYGHLFPHLKGGWDVVCLEVEKILRENAK